MKPTDEQQTIIDAALRGDNLVIEAGAGCGKTSTLRLIAEELHQAYLEERTTKDVSIAYIAYNKAIATEAQAKMPSNVTAKTAHAFAFAEVGRLYSKRMNRSERTPFATVARFLGITGDLQVGQRTLSKYNQTVIVSDMVTKFCKSADPEITTRHLPYVEGVEKEHRGPLAKALLGYAKKAWADLQSTDPTAVLRFTHDHYLKIWALTNPRLTQFDVILFDEAQDANPVIDGIVQAQEHAQRIMVGDRAQAIYGWNGAIDAMAKFEGERFYLTQSFRFGQAVADEGNAWLARLATPLRLRGLESIASEVRYLDAPGAVLCRTNAGAVQAALDLQAQGQKVHLVGGSKDLEKFALGAQDLQTKGWTSNQDLSIFKSWSEVRDYATNDPDGSDLTTLVRLVDQYTAQAILQVLRATVAEKDADVVISTAHKAKGREWASVRIAADFATKKAKDGSEIPLSDEEIMLRYVAVTRAMHVLDPGPLTSSIAAAA